MSSRDCPFCSLESDRMLVEMEHVFGVWDLFPVSPGHALVIPKRHVSSWFDATPEERAALAEGTERVRDAIVSLFSPDGFNIGINVGDAAGQTVPHLHVHVIPRYRGDVSQPRGGVRGVIPWKRDYGRDEGSTGGSSLVRGGDEDPLLPHLERQLALADRADIVVAFTMRRGVDLLFPHLEDLLDRGGRIRFLTGDYRDVTEPEALSRLLDLQGQVDLRVFETRLDKPGDYMLNARSFHPKSYILTGKGSAGVAFVGSSNISETALRHGIEWNYRVTSSGAGDPAFVQIEQAFEELFHHRASQPLTPEWIDAYRKRRVVLPMESAEAIAEVAEEPLEVPEPHEVQREALEALELTRQEGNGAGLVVLATGLGKTWLSAFDTARPEFERMLFVAHREEILSQAMRTYRKIRPVARLGLYKGGSRDRDADVLFASIQTLGRQEHLESFQPDAFDYIVVDEFHHACAATYRGLIDHFQPKFLLGLTATPERTDGGNLLALCQENLVYRCDLADGIRRGLLSPFHYYGVPDDVDYSNIPWRSTRFDEEALTNAVATERRAQNALDQWRERGGERTMVFCVSQRHADFMTEFFTRNGLRSVAVHSGEGSAPRTLSLQQLAAGELDLVCAVDMFNEGVDVPDLDTVMMLRPTESRILWLQQLGRGLRKAEGKSHLTVIDYIGNHKTFLLKPQTLFDLPSGRQQILNFLERYREGELDLPPGCEVTYDLETIEILRRLASTGRGEVEALRRHYEDFRELNGERPTATETYHEGYNPRAVRTEYGSWLEMVDAMRDLDDVSRAALDGNREFLRALEITPMVKSYKMLVLLAMLNADALPGELEIDALGREVMSLAARSAVLKDELGEAMEDPAAMRRLLEQNPIKAWAGGKGTGATSYFEYEGGTFRSTIAVEPDQREALQALVRELAEWRLAEYLDRAVRNAFEGQAIPCKVSHSGGRPIIFLPDRKSNPQIPTGSVEVAADGETFVMDFVKVAVNVARSKEGGENELPRILRGWFGPDAGRPGTRHNVVFELKDDGWELSPEGRWEGELQLWRSYSREQIPPLFGMQFSKAIWNVGYVNRSGHIVLMVTLDKKGHSSDFQYGDRFLNPSLFEWQSQNRMSRDSRDGEAIRGHVEKGIPVHLFVRREKKVGSRAAPFVYCGDVVFEEWEGDKPVTVRWRLPEPVPEGLRGKLRVGEEAGA